MAEYNNLMATINAQIKANGNQEITGPVLNAVLAAMVSVLGTGYRLVGVAGPNDDPGNPDNRVVYIASEPGDYTDFGGVEVPDDGLVYLLVHDSGWVEVQTPMYYAMKIDELLDRYALKPQGDAGNIVMIGSDNELEDTGISAVDVVKNTGIHPDMIVGAAQGFLAPEVFAEYTKRISAAGQTIRETGRALIAKLYGRSLVWNQLVQNGNFQSVSWWDTALVGYSVSNGEATIQKTASTPAVAGLYKSVSDLELVAGHIYYFAGEIKTTGGRNCYIGFCDNNGAFQTGAVIVNNTATYVRGSRVISLASQPTRFVVRCNNSDTTTDTMYAKNVVLIDLTLMFGAGNEPATPAEFEALYNLPYYDYNAGEIVNNTTTAIQTRDADDNIIGTLPLNIALWRNGGDLIYPDGMRGRGSDCDYANVERDGYIRKTTKVWESRAYQAGDESDASVITDGVSTLYKLNTPETLTLDTPIPDSYLVQNGGTEERLPEDSASAVSAPIAYDVQYTMDSRAIASPLFVNGTTDADNNFTPDAGQPSLTDAATAYLAGRRVILHIVDGANEFVQDVVAWDGPSGGLQTIGYSWG